MRILNRLGQRNKNTKHYQKNYEEVKIEGKGINIGMSSEGLVRGKQEQKEQYYKELKKQITMRDEQEIRNIAGTVQMGTGRTIYDVFAKMEEARIPLDYLVAMGLVDEIDLESYQNLKVKGLDTRDIIAEEDHVGVDETLRMQVMSQITKMPELKELITDKELGLVEPEKYIDEYQRRVDEFTEITPSHKKNTVEETEEETPYTEKLPQGEEDTVRVKKEFVQDEASAHLTEFKNLALQIGKTGRKMESRARQQEQAEEADRIRNVRSVYVIEQDALLPVIDGYNIKSVNGMEDVIEYTTSKRNLMVITQSIPKHLHKDLIDWLRGIAGTKYRIVTLKESPVGHKLVEETLELTKDSLDAYYENHPDEMYVGKDVEGFEDISKFLVGDEW